VQARDDRGGAAFLETGTVRTPTAAGNNLLGALRPDDYALLRPSLREITAQRFDVFYEPGDHVQHVYFPCGSSLVSFLVLFDDGRAVETALIGREGAVGGIVSNGRLPAYARAEVQAPGPFLRLSVEALEIAKARSPSLRNLFARYADCLVAQMFQSVACNAAHSIEQRAAKWILAAMERTGESEIPLTQEQFAEMLGVGRTYVSRVMRALRDRGLVTTKRGVLTVQDATALRSAACDCLTNVRRHFDHVLEGVYPEELPRHLCA
jgi:CRP-like cAMP-binding protein